MRVAAPTRPGTFLALADVQRIMFLAVPAMLALLSQTAINLVDTYFMGKLPEPERSDGQAMLSFSLTLLWSIGGFLSAISVGTQAMVGRREGQSHPHDSGGILANAVVVATCTSFAATIICYPLIPFVFHTVSSDPDYIRIGTKYSQWRFIGLVSMVTTAAYKAFYDGTGRTYVHFCAAIGMNIVNALLCWLIAAIGALGILCVFFKRWRDVDWLATHVVRIGLLGTVVGLIIAFSAAGAGSSADPNSIRPMIASVIDGMYVALYATLLGIATNLWLKINLRLLGNFDG